MATHIDEKPYRFIITVAMSVCLFYLAAFAVIAFCPHKVSRVYVALLTVGFSVTFGGAFGGFVFSMVAGRQYVLKLPTRVQNLNDDKRKEHVIEYELGHLGHTVVGIAAGLVAIPLVFRLTGSPSPLRALTWKEGPGDFNELFDIAEISLGLSTLSFVAGFLGLRLIASVAKSAPLCASQILAETSVPPVAIHRPSRLNAAAVTVFPGTGRVSRARESSTA